MPSVYHTILPTTSAPHQAAVASNALSKPRSSRPLGTRHRATRPNWRLRCFSHSAELSSVFAADVLPSLYSQLGLDHTVDLPQIKTAYRRMALKYHPDVSTIETRELNTKIFLQVQDAYDILSNPISREAYDLLLLQNLSGPRHVRSWEQSPGNRGGMSRIRRSEMSNSWRAQWVEQLQRFNTRESDSTSWGARMRGQHGFS